MLPPGQPLGLPDRRAMGADDVGDFASARAHRNHSVRPESATPAGESIGDGRLLLNWAAGVPDP